MKRTGNTAANKIYNPRNIKPPIPIDADEADSAMERFIRQKYESKILEDGKPKPPSRQDPSYITKSVDDTPPPLPPKPGKKIFGLRTSFGSSKSSSSGASIGHQANKQSRTFGLSLNGGNGSFESKLTILREMGFPDDRRNATILKGLNEDLDKAVETLVRLGEGTAPVYRARSPVSRTPTSGRLSDSTESKPAAASTNPFDQLDAAPLRPVVGISINQPVSQSTPNSAVATKNSYNPFDVPTSQPAASLEQSFQNLQVSQPLFPNTTGGYPSQQGQVQAPRYQSMTPPVTTTLNSGLVASPAPMNGNYNPFFQPTPATGTSMPSQSNLSPTNPFFGQMPQQSGSFQTQPQMAYPQQAMSNANNPYFPQHANTLPSYSSSSPFVQQQQPQQQLYQQPTGNPYATAMAPAGQIYQSQPGLQQQQPFQMNQPSRMDKSSILALYNFSQPPPTIPEQPQQQSEQTQRQAPPSLNRAQSYPQPSQPFQTQSNSSSTPFDTPTQSRNPFGVPGSSAGMAPAPQPASNLIAAPQMNSASNNPFPRTHMSQESIDVGRAQSGRHSPDIFASLSARYA